MALMGFRTLKILEYCELYGDLNKKGDSKTLKKRWKSLKSMPVLKE